MCVTMNTKSYKLQPNLRMVAWEVTQTCNLFCRHCRASSRPKSYEDELTTDEGYRLLEEISNFSRPIVILTGGEPLLRNDIFDLVSYGTKLGLPMALAVNGTLLNEEVAKRLLDSRVRRIAISIDGASENTHDSFRGVNGAFDAAINGAKILRKVGIPFHISTTVTKKNSDDLPYILNLAQEIGACAFHLFMFVPLGRGKQLIEEGITAQEYEKILNWYYDTRKTTKLTLKVVCAPQYSRIWRMRAKDEKRISTPRAKVLDKISSRGCMAGITFCFISSTGLLKPCGYIEKTVGDLRREEFKKLWEESSLLNNLRNLSLYKGKCRECDYLDVCGGCRARAFQYNSDYLAEEPFCVYQP